MGHVTPVEGLALEVGHLVEAAGDVLPQPRQLVALELLPAAAGDALQQLAEPVELAAVGRAHAALERPAQGGVEVAVVQQVVGDLAQNALGVELEPRLGAIPTAVAEAPCHASEGNGRREILSPGRGDAGTTAVRQS